MTYGGRKPAKTRKGYYYRYFEGYSDYTAIDDGGKVKVVRIYTAPYWVHDLTDGQWKGQKVRFALLLAAAAVLYTVGALMPLGNNRSALVGIPGGLALAAMVFLTGGIASYLTCPRKMTVYEYQHSSSAVRRWSLLSSVGMALAGLMCVVYLLLSGGADLLRVLASTGCYLASAAALCAIYRTECATEYYEEENDTIVNE